LSQAVRMWTVARNVERAIDTRDARAVAAGLNCPNAGGS